MFTGPTHAHASSIYLSPAALHFAGPGQHFYIGTSLRLDRFSIDRQLKDPIDANLTNGPSVTTTALSPAGLVAFYTGVGDRAHFGISIHTPYFERFISNEDDLRYHSDGGYLFQALGSLAGSFYLHNRVIFGVGLSLGYSQLELGFARDTALEAGEGDVRGLASDCGGSVCGAENDEASQGYRVGVGTPGLGGLFAGKNLGLSGSLAFRVRKRWWLVTSYVSPPGAIADLDLSGEVDVEDAPRDGSSTHTGDAEITFRMPQSFLLGIRGPVFPGFDFVGGARWQNYSRQDQFDLRMFGGDLEGNDVPEWYPRFRGLQDVYRAEAGLERQDGAQFRYGARVRFETGAVGSETINPLQIDGWNLSLGTGVEVRLGQWVVLTAAYDLRWYPSIDSGAENIFDPAERIGCVSSSFDFDSCEAARLGHATPSAAGSYGRLQNTFAFSIRYDNL